MDFVFKYFMCRINVSFLSNLTPKNQYSSTTSISVSSSLMTGWLSVFLTKQICTYWVLDLENLKPLSFANLFILLRFSCNYCSIIVVGALPISPEAPIIRGMPTGL